MNTSHSWIMNVALPSFILTLLVAAALQAQNVSDNIKPASETSRAWYILGQTDTAGLLNGLPQRLFQATSEERRSSSVWQGVDDGASLKLRIETEGKVEGEILVGFFKDVNWEAAEPAQVRSFPGPGEYTVERLIPGKYWVGALAGTLNDFAKSWKPLPEGAGMGVEHAWPKPVELRDGETAGAHVRVSNKYRLEANHNDQFAGHFGQWGQIDPSKLVMIKTVDNTGTVVPYCSVTVSQLVRNDDNRIDQFHGFGTDDQGLAYCDAFTGRFRITAQKVDFLPELFAVRFRSRQFPTVYQVPAPGIDVRPALISVPIDPVPDGSATLSGQVHDQFGKPLREFYMTLRREQKRGPFDWDLFSIKMPFTSDDGAYSVPGLSPGTYRVGIRHFDYPTHVNDFGRERPPVTIPDEANAQVKADFEVEAKQLYYGRALFDNGRPVTKGVWSARFGGQQWNTFAFGFNDDGTFRVLLSSEERRKVDKYQKGMVQVTAYLSDEQRSTVDVALNKLSRDSQLPTTVVLPAEPQPDKPQPAKKPADDEAFTTDGLAWISELKVLGGKERTIELADFKGKPMYLNLLGSRDTESLPQVLALYEKYADRGLVILVICTDGSTQVEELVKKHELPFTVAADIDGYAVDVFRRGRSEPGHPSNVVLNAQGERIFREVGFDGDKLDRLEAAIEQALGGSK